MAYLVKILGAGNLYLLVRVVGLLALSALTLKYVSWREWSNAEIDWKNYLALPRPTYRGSQVAAAIVWLAQVAWLVELSIRWQGLFQWPVAILLAIGIVLTIPSYYFYYEDVVGKRHRACLARCQARLDRLKRRREEEKKSFNQRFNFDLKDDPFFK
ncbi:hypothetical protein IJ096_03005 [Candidatus Saccharibacteria bacterium]|nr:hypothetical protein [Candidatus Saccharibacteria bacterium]